MEGALSWGIFFLSLFFFSSYNWELRVGFRCSFVILVFLEYRVLSRNTPFSFLLLLTRNREWCFHCFIYFFFSSSL